MSDKLDQDVINGLRELDDTGAFLRDVCRLFLTKAPEQMSTIEGFIAGGVKSDVAKIAHQLKSSSGNLGALHLGKLFAELETAANQAVGPDVSELWKAIQVEYSSVKAQLEKLQNEG